MPYLSLPPTPYHLASSEVQAVGFPAPVTPETSPKTARVVAPAAVEARLRSLVEVWGSLEIDRTTLVAQAGPLKPGGRPLPKPGDPPPPQSASTQGKLVTVRADKQEYDTKAQVFTATGNAIVTYDGSELRADRVRVDLVRQTAIAEGNVFLQRGDQRLRGDRLTYNYSDRKGQLTNASGAINLGTLEGNAITRDPQTDPGSLTVVLGADEPERTEGGGVRRLGFRADELALDGDRWVATNLRVTNDPHLPPELEIVTARAELSPISPTQDRLVTESPQLAFDGGLRLPIPVGELIFDRFQRQFPIRFGFDRQDRGGLFYQQTFDVITRPDVNLQISPQIFVQRGLQSQGNFLDTSLFGVAAKLEALFDDGAYLIGRANLASLDLGTVGKNLRANISYRRPIFDRYVLQLQYAYRERFYNGSLGFQNVQNSLGATLFSPDFWLGAAGVRFNYQVGVQGIDAERADLAPGTTGSLGKLQGAIALSKGIPLWRGEALPAEKDLGLKYSPVPITPGLDAILGLAANYGLYSSGATQGYLGGTIGLSAVFGHFSKPLFDYTRFTVSFTQGAVVGESPFFFDRVADRQLLTAGWQQQLYGPLRFTIQQSWNPSTGKMVDSNYVLEYSRRTYGIAIRYNPTREIGELVLRVNDFNWGDPSSETKPVQGGLPGREE